MERSAWKTLTARPICLSPSGLPATAPREGETYLPGYKVYISGYGTIPTASSGCGTEADCPIPDLVKTVAHVAFELDDLEAALAGKKCSSPQQPLPRGARGVYREAGAPVEFSSSNRRPAVGAGEKVADNGRQPDVRSAKYSCKLLIN